MPDELFSGQSNNSRMFTLCLALLGITLNQSSVLLGINFSLADLLLFTVALYFILRKMLIFPLRPSFFFLMVSVVVLFSSSFLVPALFPINPEPVQIFSDYIKLPAVFIYFIVGYNLAKIGLAERVLMWFSVSAILIGLLAFSPFILGKRLAFLYHGSSIRLQGLMNDPNYFSVLQSCAVAYVFATQKSGLKRFFALFVLVGSILMSGSKTGVLTLGGFLCFKLIEPLFQREIKRSSVMVRLGVASLAVILAPFLIRGWNDVLSFMSDLIPQFNRVAVLFRNFASALSGDGSSRDVTWETAVKVIGASPILGIGVGTYTGITRAMWGVRSIAHNTYLQLAAEWGIPLSLFFLSMVLWELIKSTARANSGAILKTICRDMLLIFLLGSFAISLNNARLFWLTLGILVSRCTTNEVR